MGSQGLQVNSANFKFETENTLCHYLPHTEQLKWGLTDARGSGHHNVIGCNYIPSGGQNTEYGTFGAAALCTQARYLPATIFYPFQDQCFSIGVD